MVLEKNGSMKVPLANLVRQVKLNKDKVGKSKAKGGL
jgi:hypothetical protein